VVFPQVDQKPAIILPVSAILPDRAGNSGSVFIYDNGIVKKRPIALGQPVGEGFLVESGISQGEKMVIAGVAFLMDGQSVRPFSFPGEEGVGRSKSTAE
jgi:multidrug efflux pump subunit AcrA (membrane-fusion protein)